MKRVSRVLIAVLAAFLAALVLSGCSKGEAPTLSKAQIAPPVVKEANKLYVGVDYNYMPYSGEVNGSIQGLDADVASLIASDLGLAVEFVNIPHEENASAIVDGKVDVVMSAVLGEVDPAVETVSGVYAEEAPALFTTTEQVETIKNDGLGSARVGVQDETVSAWAVAEKGAQETASYDTLNEAFEALVAGDIQAVACDAVVGAYLCGHYPDVTFVEQMGSARLVGVGVAAANTQLQEAIQKVLDTATSDGRLKLVRARWVGDLPELSLEASSTEEATVTP